jgi:ankyrin repeat protein
VINAKNFENETALMLAMKCPVKPTEMTKLLLHNGAFTKDQNIHGETPEDIAHRKNLMSVIRLLEKDNT